MAKEKDSCVQAAGGPIEQAAPGDGGSPVAAAARASVAARVGREAPDFEASAYIADSGFQNVKLSDYRGKWTVLCFYPGDFTFV